MKRRRPDLLNAVNTLRDDAQALQRLQRTRARELIAVVKRCMGRGGSAFFEAGEALAALHAERLQFALGHRSFGEMLGANGLMSRPQAAKLIDVVTQVPRDRALKLGPEKCHAILRLARISGAAPQDVFERGEIDGREFEDLSLRELAGLARARQMSASARRAIQSLVRRTQTALSGNGITGARLAAIVHHRRRVFRLDLDEDALRTLLARLEAPARRRAPIIERAAPRRGRS